jgi:hypothetical protein
MAEASTMEVRARLTAETAQFTRGMEQARRSTEQLTNTSTKLRSAMVALSQLALESRVLALVAFATEPLLTPPSRVDELDVRYATQLEKQLELGYEALNAKPLLESKGNGH